jgi:transposase
VNVRKFIHRLFKFKRYLKVSTAVFSDRNRVLTIWVKPYKNGGCCPQCGRRGKVVRENELPPPRYWRDIPVHGTTIFLAYRPRDIRCATHGRQQELIPWAEPLQRITYRFEVALLKLCQDGSQRAAAKRLGIAKSTVSDLLHRIVSRVRTGHKVRGLKILGVDELSYKKGHKYATLVYDLDKSKVVWVGKGKGKETFTEFLQTKLTQAQRDKIQYACCDMAESFISAIKENLPKAQIVLDRFHIVKALNEALDEVRKEAWREVTDKDNKAYYKGLRWILLRGSGTRTKGQTRIANALKSSNNKIYRAWLLKDDFEHFWEYSYVGAATKFLKNWEMRALKSRIAPMRKFVETLRKHKDKILPFIETGLTNAVGEGCNRICRMINTRATGFAALWAFADLIYLTIGDLDIPAQIPARFHTT